MSIPTHLSHKPIIGVDNYDKIDSIYVGNTDVEALSIGNAQYDHGEISLKVWRRVSNRWSRQSEELPIHRNLDLSILFLAALMTDVNSNYSKSSLREEIVNKQKVGEIRGYYEENENKLRPRILELKKVLDEFLLLT
ncbi:hypothetical protein EZ428_05220 [Pedobacter frigiditerrae]|uniref:Uncharacterized protein n=1 Tax=Pedobacter frigiditerrae TaxID=2530452 RepID=A0A4R0N344_9SPHI|nr:DUF6530 family protein [Pedobacter frigiditerrae]TCC94180.1 hypothetical protein EZ428_05220 [Pedobacter frigiditerrae]